MTFLTMDRDRIEIEWSLISGVYLVIILPRGLLARVVGWESVRLLEQGCQHQPVVLTSLRGLE